MPQERESQFPMVTAAEVEAAPGDPATKAARNIMVRNIPGIPRRAYLIGSNDHAPIVQGLVVFTGAVIALLDLLDREPDAPNPRFTQEEQNALGAVRLILEDHGCLE